MRYEKEITLKNGKRCLLRNGVHSDGPGALEVFLRTHEETDYLLTYPDETTMTAQEEASFLQEQTDSDGAIEILAIVDGKIVATGGIEAVGGQWKTASPGRIRRGGPAGLLGSGHRPGPDGGLPGMRPAGRLRPAGAERGGGERSRPGPVPAGGLPGIWPGPHGLPHPAWGISDPGIYAPSPVRERNLAPAPCRLPIIGV